MSRLVSVRGLIQNFWRASLPLSYGSLPGPCSRIYIVCIWSRHLKLYWRKWSLVQMFLIKHSLYNLNSSFSKHTVACSNITMLCCVSHGSISHGLIFCFLSRETWSSTRFSIPFCRFLILNSCRNQESWIASRIKSWMVLKLFEWLIHWWNNVWLITRVAWLNCLNGWLTDRQTVKFINWLAHVLNGW